VGHSAGDPTPDRGLCPRIAPQNLIEKARKEQNLDFLVGFEMEFTLLKESTDGTFLPFSSQPGCYSVVGLRDPTFHLFEECIRGLCTASIQIEGFHVEGYTGQYEIALAPQPPLEAIDTWVTTHDLIKSFFSNHGYVATMCPKPIGGDQANGAHTHVSISRPEKQSAFLAGILQRLPTLWLFFMPQKVSYVRRLNGQAGETVRWDTENRMAPVRKLGEGYWEFRCVDATANMYLVVAATLAAGLAGIMDGTHLRWPDVSIESEQSTEEVELPYTISQALEQLTRESREFKTLLGKQLVQEYVSLKMEEARRLDGLGEQALTKWMVT
jgi:glutamine synthetase